MTEKELLKLIDEMRIAIEFMLEQYEYDRKIGPMARSDARAACDKAMKALKK